MKSIQLLFRTFVLSLLVTASLAQAATVTGTVTNKTTGKPSAGDKVVLVDVQAGMGEVAEATTDSKGHYSLAKTGNSNYLVKATHQGATYFIAAPQGNAAGDITVYDVAAKVQGVTVEADVMEVETSGGQLRVTERYFVHNNSTPPTTQWTARSFEVVMPEDAVLAGAAAQRPGGLPTSVQIEPGSTKGHFYFNFPIQPDNADKSTLFQLSYQLPYSKGKYTFKTQESMPTQSVGVLIPKSMTFAAASGSEFRSVPEDPGVQTFVYSNALPGKTLEFTISGEGSIPRQQQSGGGPAMGGGGGGDQADAAANGNNGQPGGGLGNPVGTPDPLSKYKWWILGGLGLLLVAAAAVLLRRQSSLAGAVPVPEQAPVPARARASASAAAFAPPPPAGNAGLLHILKEELFALESEKAHGTISAQEYAEVKVGLEAVLKRALKRTS